MDERAFFDNLSASWDDNEILSTSDRVNKILDFIDIKKGMSVLDLGTGTGVLLPFIAERVGERGKITAVDYSEGMLQQAIRKFSELHPAPEFLNLDIENENIPGEYDRIILYCVYPHLHTPVDTLKWLEKVNLKKDGSITIAFPCGADFINNIHREKHSESDKLQKPEALAAYLRENGLETQVLADSEEAYIITISPRVES